LQLETKEEEVDGATQAKRFSGATLRAPSPLRRHHSPGEGAGASGSDVSNLSAELSSDGETTNDDDVPVGLSRPPPPQRRKSTHFVLQRAFKRYLIAKAPPVMVFHFKRFQQMGKASTAFYAQTFASLNKVDDFVSFPEILDIAPFMAPNRADYRPALMPDGTVRARYLDYPQGDGPHVDPMLYKLYGVVVHIGSSTFGGHYICYVLVDPSKVLEDGTLLVDPSQDPPTLEHLSAKAGLKDDSSEPGKPRVDNRVWYFCSE
jgi:ubiquitin carboxyl-terminal hydrolase 16/45